MDDDHSLRTDDDHSLRTYLWLLAGRGAGEGYVEARVRTERGMRSTFFDARHLSDAERVIRDLSMRTDVYVGVALRGRPRGTVDAVASAWLAWVDCDSAASTARLATLGARPSFSIASGTPGHTHAYWILQRPLDAESVRTLNLRLAAAVGGDSRCCDPARILRPPQTFNHKGRPARRVAMLEHPSAVAYDPVDLSDGLPAPTRQATPVPVRGRPAVGVDPLGAISAREYVSALSGREIGRDGKAKCPFHDDHTPSLHAYADPGRGWYCFGCGKGGSIYDFAAGLWGMQTHGQDFLRLRDRLRDEFGHGHARRPSRRSGLSL